MNSAQLLKRYLWLINFYPPYWFTGIWIKEKNADFTRIVVEMKLRFYNKNAFGGHFGGSLYAMCNPFYVFILAAHLGKDYFVIDQGATIRFRRPGKGTVHAVFEIPLETIENIKKEVDQLGTKSYTFQAQVKDTEDKIVTAVDKVIYVRKR